MPEQIDARGLFCPEPAILTHQALKTAGHGEVTVLLDTDTQVENCTRAAERLGWQAACEGQGGTFTLKLHKRSPSTDSP